MLRRDNVELWDALNSIKAGVQPESPDADLYANFADETAVSMRKKE